MKYVNMNNTTEQVLNDWWRQRSFEEMEEITGFYQDDFDDTDRHKEFIDACNELWDWYTFDIKLYYYKYFKTYEADCIKENSSI